MNIQPWIDVTRPKTLPAAAAPVLVGSALAWSAAGFRFVPALAAFLGALLLQIAVNLANDYFDFIKGIDTDERLGPQRATASGLISLKKMRIAIAMVIFLAVLDGLYLVFVGGLPVLIIGIFSILSLLAYSGGPYPLASHGLGDLFVFIFFGLVAVGGTYYVQTLNINGIVIMGSLPSAMQITAILVVNNYRDRDTDKKSGKNTLAVKIGEKATRIEYTLLLLLPYVIPLLFLFKYQVQWPVLLPLLSIVLTIPLLKQINGRYQGKELNKTLAGTAKLSLIFSILFSAGLILS
ncbi:MAG: 1,4-dihydroxy-2-naphthoate polyprenyltransferase [Spirochaetaceae bacterium]|jgi:1,4-dihydroxy-2-naphthoate octaprenyltransferase|nr:1,4-dihydroxy-2-naphthoate polyprenyltransferase [Spirochaetaceae bacterium]